MPDLTPNHPAVEAAMKSTALDTLLIDLRPRLGQRKRVAYLLARFINAALPHLTADDLRNTPAGRKLMAEVLEEEAYVMAVVISNGDAAEVTAPTPGESGRGSAVGARDALYEDPAEYLRNRASTYRAEGDA